MIDKLICFGLLGLGVFNTFHLTRLGLKGLRDKIIISGRDGKKFTGKEAVNISKIYLFFAGIRFVSFVLFLTLLISKILLVKYQHV